MGTAPAEPQTDASQEILEATKQVARLLKAAGRRFALAGSVAAYAHGVPRRTLHDTDFCILRDDLDAVADVLTEAGLHVRHPPEDWLVKSEFRGRQIDLIFELSARPVTTDLLDRAQNLPVDSVWMPVLSPTDLLGSLLTAFSEHHCDFGAALPVARALRERIDWPALRDHVDGLPMAEAFLYLLQRLDVAPPTVLDPDPVETEEP